MVFWPNSVESFVKEIQNFNTAIHKYKILMSFKSNQSIFKINTTMKIPCIVFNTIYCAWNKFFRAWYVYSGFKLFNNLQENAKTKFLSKVLRVHLDSTYRTCILFNIEVSQLITICCQVCEVDFIVFVFYYNMLTYSILNFM